MKIKPIFIVCLWGAYLSIRIYATGPPLVVFFILLISTGYCYQFNSEGNYITQSAGASGGLTLRLDAKTDEYFVGPTSHSEGFFVSSLIINHEIMSYYAVSELFGFSSSFRKYACGLVVFYHQKG